MIVSVANLTTSLAKYWLSKGYTLESVDDGAYINISRPVQARPSPTPTNPTGPIMGGPQIASMEVSEHV